MTHLALTPGEPAGIGPDLAVLWAQRARRVQVTAIADPALLAERAQVRGVPLTITDAPTCVAGELTVACVDAVTDVVPGRLNPANAGYVLQTLDRAVDGCRARQFDALVTGPVQKSVINDAGVDFSGHTEYLATRCGAARVVMLLVAGSLRVALATTHVPLREVPDLITAALIGDVLDILHRDLVERFGRSHPRILVAGLNPHAGEGGHLGREDLDVIEPAVQAARGRRIDAIGPLPADTLFTPQRLADADAVLAMYHDQGLPVLKARGFGAAVNVTLGLPIIRTSVDHGTALELAGTGAIDLGSLEAAIDLAVALAER